jgi:hypothetical protein
VNRLKPKTVEQLENKLTEAIAEVILGGGLKKLPLLPSHHTLQMMAKAAVAVYESAVENSSAGRGKNTSTAADE